MLSSCSLDAAEVAGELLGLWSSSQQLQGLLVDFRDTKDFSGIAYLALLLSLTFRYFCLTGGNEANGRLRRKKDSKRV